MGKEESKMKARKEGSDEQRRKRRHRVEEVKRRQSSEERKLLFVRPIGGQEVESPQTDPAPHCRSHSEFEVERASQTLSERERQFSWCKSLSLDQLVLGTMYDVTVGLLRVGVVTSQRYLLVYKGNRS